MNNLRFAKEERKALYKLSKGNARLQQDITAIEFSFLYFWLQMNLDPKSCAYNTKGI